jgi:excisionase family DNA binding protein
MELRSENILTFKEVCSLLKLNPHHVRSLVFKKQIPHLKIGRLLRFDLAEIEKWIEISRSSGGSNEKRY